MAEEYPSHCNSIIDYLASTLVVKGRQTTEEGTEEPRVAMAGRVFESYLDVKYVFERVRA